YHELSIVAICTVAIIYVASVATVDADPVLNSQPKSRECTPDEARICKKSAYYLSNGSLTIVYVDLLVLDFASLLYVFSRIMNKVLENNKTIVDFKH
ncbi:hypothetical protein BDF19DRAFT_429377, partial [Syncephalis fuscata]